MAAAPMAPTWYSLMSTSSLPIQRRNNYQVINAAAPTPQQRFSAEAFYGHQRKRLRDQMQLSDLANANPRNVPPGSLPVHFPPPNTPEHEVLSTDLKVPPNSPTFNAAAVAAINTMLGGPLHAARVESRGNSLLAFGDAPATSARVMAVLSDGADAILILRAWPNHQPPSPYTAWLTNYKEKMACLSQYEHWAAFRP